MSQVRIGEFFPSRVKRAEADELIGKLRSNEMIEAYSSYIIRSIAESAVYLGDNYKKVLREWIYNFISLTLIYRSMLDDSKVKIPKKLWTNSAGILWNKILASRVRNQGGTVVVFDHANASDVNLKTFKPFIEFQQADVFVTFSEPYVKYLRKK